VTLVAEPERRESSVPGPEKEIPPEARVISVRQIVVAAVATIAVLLLAWLVVEDPIAHVWYNARQQQRSGAINQKRPTTTTGQTLAILQAPAIGLNVAVVEGDSGDLLRGGPGHAPQSPLPGKVGNSVIYGHSDGWGRPFGRIGKLGQGGLLYLRLHGSRQALVFVVSSVTTTSHEAPFLRASTDHRLTLVTGSGGRSPSKYVVVTAVSGSTGGFVQRSKPVPLPRSGPVLLSRDLGLFLLRGAAAVVVVVLLRRRYSLGLSAGLATPLVLAALLALMLGLDRFLSPLG
jgi:sortase A